MKIELEDLYSHCQKLAAEGVILLALWGSDERAKQQAFILHLMFIRNPCSENMELLYNQVQLSSVQPSFPDLSDLFPVAVRLQRTLNDLLGIIAIGARDTRSWLRHQAWNVDQFPLRADFNAEQCIGTDEIYPFINVEGEGVHEIPVGPVHAGTIEPGHFRFSVVGEKVLKLEERLGYVHKGIAKRIQGLNVSEGGKIAARISGDATVAYSLAYAQAIEQATHFDIEPRVQLWRNVLLERERIANHLGDLGALGNDGGLAFGLAQFSRLKECWLRTQGEIFAHRYMMGVLVPGGVTVPFDEKFRSLFLKEIDWLRHEVANLQAIYQQHAGLQDRFLTTGRVKTELAKQLGLLGLVARASGQIIDFRLRNKAHNDIVIKASHQKQGDVAARVAIRFQEIFHSLDFIEKAIQSNMGVAETRMLQNFHWKNQNCEWSYSVVESWRGPVLIALQLNEEGVIQHFHAHDSSWQNWPALEYAILGNIVADFPLINKSFNLSYSGHDV